MTTTIDPQADQQLKARHRAMWALGDYPSIARDLVAPLGTRLVEELGVRSGERVLDVAAGTGNAAIPAAERGAVVVASDLSPDLLHEGRARAEAAGVGLEWREADAERLPFADGEFDVVMSSIGAMFAPRHEAVAAELLRVCRPGGRIGMVNWTPEGLIGEMFRTMAPYMPPPPPGASPPPRWGSEDHVRELLGDGVTALRMTRDVVAWNDFARPVDLREYFKERYGPTIATYRGLADQPDRLRALDDDFAAFAERYDRGGADGARFAAEYLLVTATRV